MNWATDASPDTRQVDNALEGTKLPVALAAAPGNDGEQNGEPDTCLHLSLTRSLRWSTDSLLYCESVGVSLLTLQLQLEQNLTARLLRFVTTLVAKLESRQSNQV